MKKFFVLIVTFCLAVALISCASKNGKDPDESKVSGDRITSESSTDEQTQQGTDSGTEVTDTLPAQTEENTTDSGADTDNTQETGNGEGTDSSGGGSDTDKDDGNNTEIVESEKYYSVSKDDRYFYYTILDASGNTVHEDKTTRPLTVRMSDEDVVEISIGYGTGISSRQYYSVSRNALSEELYYVIANSGELVAYLDGELGDRSIIITNVFDKSLAYVSHKTDLSPTIMPVTGAEFSDDSSYLDVEYLSGDKYTDKQHRIYVKTRHMLVTVKDCYVRTDTVISADTILRVGSGRNAVVMRAANAHTLVLLEAEPVEGGAYTTQWGVTRNDWYKVEYEGQVAYVTADSFIKLSYDCEGDQAVRMCNAALKNHIRVYSPSSQTYIYRSELIGEENTENIKFAVVDMDGDGEYEVVIDGGETMMVLRYSDKRVNIYALDFRSMYSIRTDGAFYWTNGTVSYGCARLSFTHNGGVEWTNIYEIAFDGSAYLIGGDQVTEEELIKYINSLPVADSVTWRELTYKNIDTYLSTSCDDRCKIPVDISSYESIIDLYKMMVELTEYYTNEGKLNGVYHRAFYFPSEKENEWFDRIFDSVYQFCPKMTPDYANAFGYAIKDINGDGTDELILMLDEYYIIAIFTMKDGKPVLLDTYIPRGQAQIRENGDIYVHANGGADVLVVMICRIGADGELELVNAAGYMPDEEGKLVFYKMDPVDLSVTYITEGEFIEITDPKSNYRQYMKSVVGIKFVPLFEVSAPNESYAQMSTSHALKDALLITKVEEKQISFKLLLDKSEEIASAEIMTATLKDGVYAFSTEKVSGHFEFCTDSVWVIIDSSEDQRMPVGAYLFEYNYPSVG